MELIREKVALVTGGASGIGLSMVKQLLSNDAKGVAIVDISDEAGQNAIKEISSLFGDGRAIFIKTDVTVKEELEEAFETTIRTYKQMDIVINNAGIVDENMDWQKTIAVNLIAVIEGVYLAMQKYLPRYKSGNEGIIVNTASILGLEKMPYMPTYCATKHGLIGFGQSLGCDRVYKKYNVRILTICPGAVDTPLARSTDSSKVFLGDNNFEKEQAKFIPQQPERVGEALIEVIKNGKNGSLWVTEENELYEVVVPHRKSMKV